MITTNFVNIFYLPNCGVIIPLPKSVILASSSKNLAPILCRKILIRIRNYEILIPTLSIILAFSIVVVWLEKVRPESPVAGMNLSS